ncbi:DUF3299 domain-containing protein [Candidatus Seribacter sulfatis]|jgi:hypothetical protein|uniref:DUF3299 domain-containing protein n=1 Tax=Candidatus Seribacter sulfatis TaxID=3381756 RepID=UPI00389ABE0B
MPPKIYLFLISIFLFSCGKEEEEDVAQTIIPVGEPIIVESILTVELDSNESNFSRLDSQPEPLVPVERLEESIEEGIILNGVAQPNRPEDANESIANHLPPIDENSIFEPLAFRDISGFTYDVNWERDGKDFDFASYSQRVPKNLREKSGKTVAVEGFMLPTVVDENNMVKEFLLLPDQMSCCFGKSPEANGWVVVSSSDGVEVLMDQIIRVNGNLTVEERWDEEFFVGLYHLDCENIIGPSL